MTQHRQSQLIWGAVILSIAGCGPVGGWWPLLVLALSLLASACIELTSPPKPDAGSTAEPDASEGTWHNCCDDGVITSCLCPANAVCNYAPFTDCGDGTCSYDWEDAACGASDGGQVDSGTDAGHWETCCEDGVVSSCFCPIEVSCNYADFDISTCGKDGGSEPPDGGVSDGGVDAGSSDAGSWDTCCQDGVITTCFCPANWACNYGWFTNCGGGTCADGVFPADASVCPADAGRDGG